MNMIKRIGALLLVGALAVSMTACGDKKSYFQNVKASDYVTLGQYKNLDISTEELDEQWESTVSSILSMNPEDVKVDRASAVGDKVTYSATAVKTADGSALDALRVTDTTVTLAEEAEDEKVIGLNAALTGKAASEEPFQVQLTLADDYSTEDTSLNGLAVTYTITVSSVTESVTPTELTDDMVKSYTELMSQYMGSEVYSTIDEYREAERKDNIKSKAWTLASENAEVNGYPEEEMRQFYHDALDNYSATAAQNGQTLETYLPSAMGKDTLDEALYSVKDSAIEQTRNILIYLAIYDAENLNYKAEYKNLKSNASYDGYDKDYLKLVAKIITVENYLYDVNPEKDIPHDHGDEEDGDEAEQTTAATTAADAELPAETTAATDATDAQTSAANDDEDEIDPSDAAVSADA